MLNYEKQKKKLFNIILFLLLLFLFFNTYIKISTYFHVWIVPLKNKNHWKESQVLRRYSFRDREEYLKLGRARRAAEVLSEQKPGCLLWVNMRSWDPEVAIVDKKNRIKKILKNNWKKNKKKPTTVESSVTM